jgi:hypothetical protein
LHFEAKHSFFLAHPSYSSGNQTDLLEVDKI